jgi:hypothetical protein
MLRVLVISLFVANLLLLAFQDDKPEVKPELVETKSVEENSNIPTIHLFSEMMEDQGLLSGSRRCFSLGPFHTIEDRDETRSRIMEVSARISERETQALVEKGYWVFMPPYASLLIANQELLALQALGLKDIAVIYDGDWKNAISLGYFLRQENANRRKKSLEDRRYSPLIRVQRQSEPRYWLDYEQNTGSELITLDMQDRPNDFMQRALPCPEEDMFELTEAGPQVTAQAAVQSQTPETETDSSPVDDAGTQVEEVIEPVPDQDEGLETDGTNEPDVGQGEDLSAADTTDPVPPQIEAENVPEDSEPDSTQAEDLNNGDRLENSTQEGVEDAPESAIETQADSETETGPPER